MECCGVVAWCGVRGEPRVRAGACSSLPGDTEYAQGRLIREGHGAPLGWAEDCAEWVQDGCRMGAGCRVQVRSGRTVERRRQSCPGAVRTQAAGTSWCE